MRTIKFRGKRVNGGEWVESMTISHGTIKRKAYEVFFEISPEKWVGVIPETVGQFTGLLDKNSKEIYENDILLIAGMYYQIIFQDGCFGFKNDYCKFLPISLYVLLRSEVMGNVYDNPELLKGESI